MTTAEMRSTSMRLQLLIAALLLPLYSSFFVFAYWLFIDVKPPLTVQYQHPKFLSSPVNSRAEAAATEITEAESGSTVWVWREICRLRKIEGEGRPSWESGSFQWGGPQRTLSGPVGCVGRASPVDVPSVLESRNFTYRTATVFELNPLSTVTVEYPPLELRVHGSSARSEADEHQPRRTPNGK